MDLEWSGWSGVVVELGWRWTAVGVELELEWSWVGVGTTRNSWRINLQVIYFIYHISLYHIIISYHISKPKRVSH